ncbi:MAG: ATP-dependent sacrificial sulfur transferase LarE [Candidatus Humimicrobiaceae bacterium]
MMEKTLGIENHSTEEKFNILKADLKSMGSALVAFSGGVDSTFLLKVALDELKDKVIAVTAKSLSFPEREIKKAIEIAQYLKVKHLIIESSEMENPNYLKNDLDRCYYCKTELFGDLKKVALKEKLNFILDGQNYDDLGDYRPGMKAAAEIGVRSPLKEACLTKNDIRKLSKKIGLPNWDSPSFACLASRIPYGTEIDREILAKIDFLENMLIDIGFSQVRVRHHNAIARIEVTEEEMQKFNNKEIRMQVIKEFKNKGYLYITLDLEGYKTGSMNKVLKKN